VHQLVRERVMASMVPWWWICIRPAAADTASMPSVLSPSMTIKATILSWRPEDA
jgi:hypothetical protein